jgi:hypothetical protein
LFRSDITKDSIEAIKQKYNEITEVAPNVHNSLWKNARQQAGGDLFIPEPAPGLKLHRWEASAREASERVPGPAALPDDGPLSP